VRFIAAVAGIGWYGGYFGAAAGVLMLALFLAVRHESFPRANAAKNLLLGVANLVAATLFVVLGNVDWGAFLPLALGLLAGGRLGPPIVRRVPAAPLRAAIGLAGLVLAVRLGVQPWQG